ncbi:MAG: response regulator [Bdellovibrio sp.]
MIAEDNEVNQKVIRLILEKNGYQFSFAKNGLEAIQMYQNNTYQLILMDCQMPELDGLQACQEIRNIEKLRNSATRCPIIAMTANTMLGDREKCLQVGMDDFLAKPFRSQDLLRMVSNWCQPRGAKEVK